MKTRLAKNKYEYILEYIRDDDPKVVDPKTGKKKGFAKNELWAAGTINLYKKGLTDVHVHALCEALKEFPCIMNIDLRRNFLSYRSANYFMETAQHQLKRVTETDYYENKPENPQSSLHTQCMNCHEELIFRKRDSNCNMHDMWLQGVWKDLPFAKYTNSRDGYIRRRGIKMESGRLRC